MQNFWDRQIDRQTDIIAHRAAIAAKKILSDIDHCTIVCCFEVLQISFSWLSLILAPTCSKTTTKSLRCHRIEKKVKQWPLHNRVIVSSAAHMFSWIYWGSVIHSILPTVKLFQCVGFHMMENRVKLLRCFYVTAILSWGWDWSWGWFDNEIEVRLNWCWCWVWGCDEVKLKFRWSSVELGLSWVGIELILGWVELGLSWVEEIIKGKTWVRFIV